MLEFLSGIGRKGNLSLLNIKPIARVKQRGMKIYPDFLWGAVDKYFQKLHIFSQKKLLEKHLLNGSSVNEALPVKWRIE